eukprot:1672823-Prymnesium_polylepis.1
MCIRDRPRCAAAAFNDRQKDSRPRADSEGAAPRVAAVGAAARREPPQGRRCARVAGLRWAADGVGRAWACA